MWRKLNLKNLIFISTFQLIFFNLKKPLLIFLAPPCWHEDVPFRPTLNVDDGDNITIVSMPTGSPRAEVQWFLNGKIQSSWWLIS